MRLGDLEGKVIADRFQLKSMIGKGGYGAVFEAVQLSVKRRCAVKILLPGRTDEDAVESRFHAEARTTSRLTHPNSLVLYDFGVDEATGFLFLATEFIDGKTLHQVLETRATLSVSRTLTILEQVAGSLADAHSHGLVHRDIKPKNIMIVERAGQKDFVKVIDFGIAKALGGSGTHHDLTQTGMLVGTPQYMAPEQLLGGNLDGRVDQYTMAVVGYKMLTGRNPFRGATAMKTAMRHVNDDPLPLRTYRPELEVSALFEDIFLRALEKVPEHRYPSTVAFVEALKKAADCEEASAQKEGSLFGEVEPELLQRKTLMIDDPEPQNEEERLQALEVTTRSRAPKPTVKVPSASQKIEMEHGVMAAEEVPNITKRRETLPTIRIGRTRKQDKVFGGRPPKKSETPARIDKRCDSDIGNGSDETRRKPQRDRIHTLSPVSAKEVEVAGRKLDESTAEIDEEHDSESQSLSPLIIAFTVGSVFIFLIVSVSVLFWSLGDSVQEPEASAAVPAQGEIEADEVEEVVELDEGLNLQPTVDVIREEVTRAQGRGLQAAQTAADRLKEERRRREQSAKPGEVTVTLIPWGTLFVNGEAISDATRQQISLSPGRYELSLRQRGELRARQTVDVEAGASKMVVLEARFDP